MNIASELKKSGVKSESVKQPRPVWKGPEVDGVTQSMIGRFLVCRERFRILVVEGLRSSDGFQHRIEYGQMWHACEEANARGKLWNFELPIYCKGLLEKYPMQQEQIDHWYNICKVQFPIYLEYWRHHPDAVNRTPLLQEQVFNVPYELPSGRVVKLRGKWDGVSLIGRGKAAGIELDEHKTKGDIDESQLKRQLTFDLQTMLYLVALEIKQNVDKGFAGQRWHPIRGVRYNVIRRPLSGGKGTIRRHEPTKSNPTGESKDAFYQRVAQYIKDEPQHFFMRWRVEITDKDIARFKTEFLNPVLEQMCDWWDCIGRLNEEPFDTKGSGGIHWRHPFGVFNSMNEGSGTELDEYIATGSEIGLRRINKLFEELEV